jgi:hypothetical protein
MDKHPCLRVYGRCGYGSYCKYANEPAHVCLFWLKGVCKYRTSCRWGTHHPHRESDVKHTASLLQQRCLPCRFGNMCSGVCERAHGERERTARRQEWEQFMSQNWTHFRTKPCRHGALCNFDFCLFRH